jgi:hypothetical protein
VLTRTSTSSDGESLTVTAPIVDDHKGGIISQNVVVMINEPMTIRLLL